MARSTTSRRPGKHRHEWVLFDPFHFDGPIYMCSCGQKRLDTDLALPTATPVPSVKENRATKTRGAKPHRGG